MIQYMCKICGKETMVRGVGVFPKVPENETCRDCEYRRDIMKTNVATYFGTMIAMIFVGIAMVLTILLPLSIWSAIGWIIGSILWFVIRTLWASYKLVKTEQREHETNRQKLTKRVP